MIKNPFSSAIKRFLTKEAENQLYAKASKDLELNIIDPGIWGRAFAKAEGNETKAKALYIELMVQHYKDLFRAGEELEMILKSEEEKAQVRAVAAAAEKAEKDAEEARIIKDKEYWDSPEGQEEIKKADKDSALVILGAVVIIIFIFLIGTAVQ